MDKVIGRGCFIMPKKMDATMLHEKEGEIHNFYAPLIHSLICFKGTLKHLGAFESCKEVKFQIFLSKHLNTIGALVGVYQSIC